MLGKLAQKTSLFEVFRNPVKTHQITECLSKLFDIQLTIRREKRTNSENLLPEEIPFLWILTPTLAAQKLELFAAKTSADWPEGIYFLPPGLNTAIVVIHQLAVERETLWLRMLGKGKVQEKAIDEIKALPKNHSYRENVLELIGNLFAIGS